MYDFYGKDRVSPDIARLYNDLLHVWRADTCAPRMRRNWKPSDPTLGQCSITSFLVQDIKGGEIYGVPLGDGNYHCYNVIDGVVFDLTSEQFGGKKLEYKCEYPQKREEHFAKKEKYERYLLLKKRYEEYLGKKKDTLYLGIELGSTRIKSVLLDGDFNVIANGGFDWENRFENGYFTYPLDLVLTGLRQSYRALSDDYFAKTGKRIEKVDALGVSAMMHGYLVFDEDMQLLTPFRTWRNAKSKQASDRLTELFGVHIPQRWSVSNLYQCMLDNEKHVGRIASLTTLSGYIHRLLTGKNEVGLCEASGMFPVKDGDYDGEAVEKFDEIARSMGYKWDIRSILPAVRPAGHKGAYLTEEGARLLDPDGYLKPGIPVCPPEGDAGTGMTATNSVRPGSGNVSAGTSVFAQLVLDKPLSRVYRQCDTLKTPDGCEVALIHSNNGCSEIDAWVKTFGEFANLLGVSPGKTELYSLLYNNTKNAAPDCGGVTSYNCISSEPINDIAAGYPLVYRPFDGRLDLANLIRSQICAIFAPLITGMRVLSDNEGVKPGRLFAHGGLFKIRGIAQQILADAFDAPVSVLSSAGEGGAYGMALLAAYMADNNGGSLPEWLDNVVFASAGAETLYPDEKGVEGYKKYMENYEKGLFALRALNI